MVYKYWTRVLVCLEEILSSGLFLNMHLTVHVNLTSLPRGNILKHRVLCSADGRRNNRGGQCNLSYLLCSSHDRKVAPEELKQRKTGLIFGFVGRKQRCCSCGRSRHFEASAVHPYPVSHSLNG